jgi:hypothetical protein
MVTLKAKSKNKNLQKDIRPYLILVVGFLLTILSYYLYSQLIVVFTLGVCTIMGFILHALPPTEYEVYLDEEVLRIGETEFEIERCVAWSVVDLKPNLEIIIQTDGYVSPFYYFYVNEENPDLQEFVGLLTQLVPYDEELSKADPIHIMLRKIGLK